MKFVRFPQNPYSAIETGGSAGKIPQKEQKRRLKENGEGIKKKKKKKRSCAHRGPQILFDEEQKKKKKRKRKRKEATHTPRSSFGLFLIFGSPMNWFVMFSAGNIFCLLRRLKRRMDCMRDKRETHSNCSGLLRGKDEGGEEQPAAERAATTDSRESPFSAYLRSATGYV